ncbi:ATP-binding protein [Candidatus Peregrinibacteria bacterium]|nr:ATP-binding protein [Candidatus Peregrinibacteria bacterium]
MLIKGISTSLHWKQGEENPDLDPLAKVAVFDAHSARVYLEEKNLLHVPYGLDVFTGLSKLCSSFKERLKQEQRQFASENHLPFPAPELSDETEAGKFYEIITRKASKCTLDEIDQLIKKLNELTELTPKDLEDMKKLKQSLEDEPKNRADKLDKLVLKLERLQLNLSELSAYFSSGNFEACAETYRKAKKFAKESKKKSEELFKQEPLGGVGDDLWREMFLKVKEYSEKLAYPEEVFPCLREGALCPTCQQVMTPETKQRFGRFNDFISDELSKTLTQMKKAYLDLAGVYQRLETDPVKNDPTLLAELSAVSPWLSLVIQQYLDAVRVWNYKDEVSKGEWVLPSKIGHTPDVDLMELIIHLKSEVAKLRESAKPEEREKLQKRYDALADRKTLYDHKQVLQKYLNATKSVLRLDACIKDTRVSSITDIGKKLTREIVTDKLKDAFLQELVELGLTEVKEKITMVDSGSDGGAYVRLELASANFDHERLSSVLSDGELRMVAVASFLAELRAVEKTCTIVFDDPVSSLDHKWRRKAAKRLIKETIERQVIIFTHDIVFFRYLQQEQEKYNLKAASKGESGVVVSTQLVEKINKVPGHCTSEQLPWELRSAKKRIGTLKSDLQQIEALYNKGQLDEYKNKVLLFADKSRKTWEKAVEGDLLGSIVQRFVDDVQTRTLKDIEIDDRDWARVEKGMGDCSEIIHDIAEAKQEEMPVPADLKSLLDDMESFLTEVDKRKEATRKRRKSMLEGNGQESIPAEVSTSKLNLKLGEIVGKEQVVRPFNTE